MAQGMLSDLILRGNLLRGAHFLYDEAAPLTSVARPLCRCLLSKSTSHLLRRRKGGGGEREEGGSGGSRKFDDKSALQHACRTKE